MKPDISEVHFLSNGGYRVKVKIERGKVTGVFEVALSSRRQRTGYTKELKHHRKTYEMLEGEAREAVTRFCREISEALNSAPSPH